MARETKTETIVCPQSDACRAMFCASHPTCTVDRVDRTQIVPITKYKVTYHYEPKYVFRGETGPDFCTKSCSNTSGSNSTLCEAWEKSVLLKRAVNDGTTPEKPLFSTAMLIGISVAVVLLVVTMVAVAVVAKKKQKP